MIGFILAIVFLLTTLIFVGLWFKGHDCPAPTECPPCLKDLPLTAGDDAVVNQLVDAVGHQEGFGGFDSPNQFFNKLRKLTPSEKEGFDNASQFFNKLRTLTPSQVRHEKELIEQFTAQSLEDPNLKPYKNFKEIKTIKQRIKIEYAAPQFLESPEGIPPPPQIDNVVEVKESPDTVVEGMALPEEGQQAVKFEDRIVDTDNMQLMVKLLKSSDKNYNLVVKYNLKQITDKIDQLDPEEARRMKDEIKQGKALMKAISANLMVKKLVGIDYRDNKIRVTFPLKKIKSKIDDKTHMEYDLSQIQQITGKSSSEIESIKLKFSANSIIIHPGNNQPITLSF